MKKLIIFLSCFFSFNLFAANNPEHNLGAGEYNKNSCNNDYGSKCPDMCIGNTERTCVEDCKSKARDVCDTKTD